MPQVQQLLQVGTSPATFTVRDGAAALGQFSHGPAIGGGTTPSVDYYNVLLPSGTPIGRFVGGAESERRYYHTDHLGSTRAVTDPSGTVVERRDHYPFIPLRSIRRLRLGWPPNARPHPRAGPAR
ncbi:MAG: hypothetical protein PPP56_04200 [Longimonas sp.]|uniref:hypothetical protein n=1 Tax=Longimonas sp. TaxID=2039626 RepID=UPI0033596CF2